MKKEKVVLFILSILSMLLLTLSIGNLVQIQELKNESQEQQAQINELQPTQTQRYFNSIIDDLLIEKDIQFIEFNKTIISRVDALSNSMYVIESTETKIVKVTITIKNNFLKMYDNSVDVHIYYDTLAVSDITYDHTQNTMTYTFALQKGFNTIELDNYANSEWSYIMRIKEIN